MSELDVEFKRDLYNNYMILKENKLVEEDYYGIKMVLNNQIEGLLKMDFRVMDNKKYYYYDITAKQSLALLGERGQFTKVQITAIFSGIIKSLDSAREYLLKEDDFILLPEFLYIDLPNYNIYLCYYAGYQKDIKNQINSLIEFLMEKVNYKEDDAVLLTYSLYKISKSEVCTIPLLKETLEKKPKEEEETAEERDKIYQEKEIPVMKERVESQEEVLIYPVQVWMISILSILFMAGIFTAGFKFEFFTNKVSRSLNINNIIASCVILGGIEIYILIKLFDLKNKVPKIKTKTEFFDIQSETEWDYELEEKDSSIKNKEKDWSAKEEKEEVQEENTVLLCQETQKEEVWLKSLDAEVYKDILVQEFPFFVGKLRTCVDSSINSAAVSRYHAKLEQREELYFITDLNSTNGTYVNRVPVEPGKPMEIKKNDIITFANISYCFVKN